MNKKQIEALKDIQNNQLQTIAAMLFGVMEEVIDNDDEYWALYAVGLDLARARVALKRFLKEYEGGTDEHNR